MHEGGWKAGELGRRGERGKGGGLKAGSVFMAMSLKRKLSDCDVQFTKRAKLDPPPSRLGRSQSTPRRPLRTARLQSLPPKPTLQTICEGATRRAGPTNLTKRAKAREVFDLEVKQKMREMEAMRREDDLGHQLREEHCVKLLRKGMVFKAQPIHRYPCLCVKRSDRKLTEPHSPTLRTALRAELQEATRDL